MADSVADTPGYIILHMDIDGLMITVVIKLSFLRLTLIRADPTWTSDLSQSGPTFVPASWQLLNLIPEL